MRVPGVQALIRGHDVSDVQFGSSLIGVMGGIVEEHSVPSQRAIDSTNHAYFEPPMRPPTEEE
jgi:hypothetical protein